MSGELTLVVVVVVGLIGLSIFDRVTIRSLAGQVLAGQLEMEREHRAEREKLMRAVLAKTTGELANLERIENAGAKIRAAAAGDDGRRVTEAEWQRMVAEDLTMMGEDPRGVFGDRVPSTPEGL